MYILCAYKQCSYNEGKEVIDCLLHYSRRKGAIMNNKKILVAASLGIFLCMLDTTIMNITLPAIQDSFKVELKDLSWALNVYTIIFASLTIPLAKLSELWGKEKAFVCSLLLFMTSSLLCGFSSDLSMLIFARLLQGISASALFPLSMIIGVSNTSIDQRDKVIAVLGVTQGFAAAVGPTLGGVISQYLSWHWVFWINVPVVLVALVLAISGLEFQTKANIKFTSSIDFLGSALSMISLFSITTYLIQGSTWGWLAFSEIFLLTMSLLTFIVFIMHERKTTNPMIPLQIFKNRMFSATTVIVVVSNFFLIGMMVILPNMFTKVYGFTELKAALLITPISVMIFIFSPVSALLVKRVGPRLLIGIGFTILSIGYLLISFINVESYILIITVCTLVGIGYGIIIGPATLLAASDFTGEMLTASQSIIGVVRQIGIVIGVALFVSSLTGNQVLEELQNSYINGDEQEKSIIIELSNTLKELKETIKNAYIDVYSTMTPFVLIAIFSSFLFPSKKSIRRNN